MLCLRILACYESPVHGDTIDPRLDDPTVVEAEYQSEARLVRRRLDYWASFEGENPEDVVVQTAREVKPRRVLEVGCGTGVFAVRLATDLQADIVALDSSPRLVELTRARGIDAREGDVQRLPFDDHEFDCVVANWVLYHVPDLDRGLREIARVLRPDGRLVATTNSQGHLREVWELVGREVAALSFDAENGATRLQQFFATVSRRDTRAKVTFPSAEALRGYVDAFVSFSGESLSGRVPDAPEPFVAHALNSVFVADEPL